MATGADGGLDWEVTCRRLQRLTDTLLALCEEYQVQAELFSDIGVHLDPTLADLRERFAKLVAEIDSTAIGP